MQKKSRNILKLFLAILVLSLLFIAACSNAPETSPAAPASSTEDNKVETKIDTIAEAKTEVTVAKKSETKQETSQANAAEPSSETSQSAASTTESAVKEISMSAKAWAFEPSTIELNKGDKVKLTITATDVKHGISIWGINKRLEPNKPEVIEFTADEAGEFPFFCTVYCGDGHGSMKGKVIVK